MQLANCHVRLSGDMNNEIFKARVTPPEVLILRAIHGSDAVLKFQPLGMDKRPHAGEVERLKAEYGAKVFGEAFPGAAPNLPISFKDIGIDLLADEKPAKSRRRAPETVAAGGTSPEDDGADDGDDQE